jgi:hypothetical protein
MAEEGRASWSIVALASDLAEAERLAAAARALPSVESVQTVRTFAPADSEEKIARIADLELQLAGQRPERGARAHGCLLTNTAAELGSEPEAVANLVSKAFRRMERALALRLREAKRQGDLAEAVNATRFARQLVALIQGLRVMTRLGVGNQVLRDAVQSALAPLGAGKQTKRKRRKHEQGSASNQGAGPVRRHAVRQHLGAG